MKYLVALVASVLLLTMLVVGPFITMWSLNTLFGLTFTNWLAWVWLMAMLGTLFKFQVVK